MRDLDEVSLAADEMEAIRLADFEGMYHVDAAKGMGVSRQTFDRIVGRARRKVAEALVKGRSLRIENPPAKRGVIGSSPVETGPEQ
jgi:predicted DNA-binding protein (UPF0251 family)